ncbi:MAG TPA: ATP-binding protein [Chloroflexota bacterium]
MRQDVTGNRARELSGEPGAGAREKANIRAKQQAAVARLGEHALAGAGLGELFDECCRSAADELAADYSKVLELLPHDDLLVMRSGVGWTEGYVGSATVEGGTGSQAGYTLLAGGPVILEDVRTERRFHLSELHRVHKITSGVTVVISGVDRPFGILGAYTIEYRAFSRDDINFLQALANVLSAAIQRKRAEEEREELLREMRALAETAQMKAAELQGVLDNMLDGVFVADEQRRAVLVNRAGAALLGLRDAPLPLDLEPLLSMRRENGQPFADEHPIIRALAGQEVALEAAVVPGTAGERDISLRINAAPIRDETGRVIGAVAVTRDVTELAEWERLREQFISMAAHELKTPVAVMKGYAQALLKMGEVLPPNGRKMLGAIDRGSDRIDRIVRDLLDISRFHVGELALVIQPVDLAAVVRAIVEKVALGLPKHRIRLSAPGAALVMGDRTRIEQVVLNLLDNAAKYSPDGGEIEVRIDEVDLQTVVSVTDHGLGIPLDKQGRIFERFFRAHVGTPQDFGGMGVGLYISRELIARQGGYVWFESKPGEGSVFHFSLPTAGSGETGE